MAWAMQASLELGKCLRWPGPLTWSQMTMQQRSRSMRFFAFFLLLAAKVRSSCEEGPGQSALQSAYHDPKLDVTELKQNRTSKVQAKNCKQTN